MQPHLVQHRVNTTSGLRLTDTSGGVEIDLRSSVNSPGVLHLSHDPWIPGEPFEEWLVTYAQMGFAGPLILNTKEDGLEEAILACLKIHHIEHFFFLDTAAPTLVRLLDAGMGAHTSLRVSAWETTAAAEAWLAPPLAQNRPHWIWLDCFGGAPMVAKEIELFLHHHKTLKMCLVSPELQRSPISLIPNFRNLGRLSAAICTKHPAAWHQTLKDAE